MATNTGIYQYFCHKRIKRLLQEDSNSDNDEGDMSHMRALDVAILFQPNPRVVNPNQRRMSINAIADDDVAIQDFRFRRVDMHRLFPLLRLPDVIVTPRNR